MIKVVLIAVVILLILIIGYIIGNSSKSSDEYEHGDDEEADFEIDYNAGSVVAGKNTPGAERENDDVKTPEPAADESGVVLITGAEARELYESNDAVILLDVRNQDEFDNYHIVGSLLIPVDELESRLSEIPDKDALIIVFCRAGRRSAIAAELLISKGYSNIHDMQGIDNW